jgi:hypothetical protein
MRLHRLCVFAALFIGCDTRPRVPVEVAGDVPLGVSFGETLSIVRAKRPQIAFVPYAGWIEDRGGAGPFRTVVYQFGNAPAGESPENRGRLSVVRLTGASVAETGDIVRRLDEAFGPHRYVGCTSVPPRTTPEEIAALRWDADDFILFAEVLMSHPREGQVRIQQPIVVTAADKRTGKGVLGFADVQARCFSRGFRFR